MSELAKNFLKFLLEKHNQTGRKRFTIDDYMVFNGYRNAITELYGCGAIEKEDDILGTIIVRLPED